MNFWACNADQDTLSCSDPLNRMQRVCFHLLPPLMFSLFPLNPAHQALPSIGGEVVLARALPVYFVLARFMYYLLYTSFR